MMTVHCNERKQSDARLFQSLCQPSSLVLGKVLSLFIPQGMYGITNSLSEGSKVTMEGQSLDIDRCKRVYMCAKILLSSCKKITAASRWFSRACGDCLVLVVSVSFLGRSFILSVCIFYD